MTDLDLQDALIGEMKSLLAHHSLKKPDGEAWKDFNVYRQAKPYKDDEADDDQEDYIVVLLDDEDTDADGNWIVYVQMIISIWLFDAENQGNVLLASLMNQIDLHLCKMGIIAGRYEMEGEKHKRFNHECLPPYYECNFITKWRLPAANMEGDEDLV